MTRTQRTPDPAPLASAAPFVRAPLVHSGKVRELYDLGDRLLIVVTDRISAFDFVLRPPIPGKGRVLNSLSRFWFERTRELVPNHMVHADVGRVAHACTDVEPLRGRVMVARRAERIDVECVVRGYLAGGGWRQYEATGRVNGIELPAGIRKNQELPTPIFTPAAKNDVGHDEDISFDEMAARVGIDLAQRLRDLSLALYRHARGFCAERGVILADTKFEFGLVDGEPMLIDELFTPDCSRFWTEDAYELDVEIASLDKEPVRTYLAGSDWDRTSEPPPLPGAVVAETSERYSEILHRLTGRTLREWTE